LKKRAFDLSVNSRISQLPADLCPWHDSSLSRRITRDTDKGDRHERDRTLPATNIWLDDLMKEMGWKERQRADHALRAMLHALRDRLPVEEASHLSAQLPLLVRGIYFEGWHPAKVPVRERMQDQFLTHVTEAFLFDVDLLNTAAIETVLHGGDVHTVELEQVPDSAPAAAVLRW
jgi:uncharacterized protein (DUF2267 family)